MVKVFLYGGVTIGGLVGAYLPVILLHASALGGASILGSTIGGFVGLWAGYKVYRYLDL